MWLSFRLANIARNTLDTLHHVSLLKEKGIAVFFKEEKINTMTMDGELLLEVLSSVAQQEVENLSAHVKKSLKLKMKKGEFVGFHGCLGYDYDKESKSLSVNKEEAEIVRYIFRRYAEGAGGMVSYHLHPQRDKNVLVGAIISTYRKKQLSVQCLVASTWWR